MYVVFRREADNYNLVYQYETDAEAKAKYQELLDNPKIDPNDLALLEANQTEMVISTEGCKVIPITSTLSAIVTPVATDDKPGIVCFTKHVDWDNPADTNENGDPLVTCPSAVKSLIIAGLEAFGIKVNAYDNIVKHRDYLYEVSYSDLNYGYAYNYYEQFHPVLPEPGTPVTSINRPLNGPGGCSSAKSGNWYVRSFDWNYDDLVEFVVRTNREQGRFATLGICSDRPELTKSVVESGEPSSAYTLVPFTVVDGINEYGVVCNININPVNDLNGITTGTTPTGELRDSMCGLMLPRYILDHYRSATEAVTDIREHVSIYGMYKDGSYREFHCMVADHEKVYVLECWQNELRVLDVTDDHPQMTNFPLVGRGNGLSYNEDGTVDYHTVTDYAAGLERYDYITSCLSSHGGLNSLDEAHDLARGLRYTQAFERNRTPVWYTEFVADYGEPFGRFTVTDAYEHSEKFNPILDIAYSRYENRQRDGQTWQSVHATVADLNSLKLHLYVQEDYDDELEFGFNYYTAEQSDSRYSRLGHSHTVADITDFPENVSYFSNDADYQSGSQVDTKIEAVKVWTAEQGYITEESADSKYSVLGHTHAVSDITDFPENVSHFNNDSNYQSESQVDTKDNAVKAWVTGQEYLTEESGDSLYSKLGHNHVAADITDFPADISYFNNDADYQTETQVDTKDNAVKTWVAGQGYLTSETDPIFSASPAAGITTSDIERWNTGGNTIESISVNGEAAPIVNKNVNITMTAAVIPYGNTTVGSALSDLYTKVSIAPVFTETWYGPPMITIGESTEVTIGWEYSKEVVSQTVNDVEITADARQYTTTLTGETPLTVVGTDAEGHTVEYTFVVPAYRKYLYGAVGEDISSLNELTNYVGPENKFRVYVPSGKYFYFGTNDESADPKTFSVNGMAATLQYVKSIDGYSLYRSLQSGLGSIVAEINYVHVELE